MERPCAPPGRLGPQPEFGGNLPRRGAVSGGGPRLDSLPPGNAHRLGADRGRSCRRARTHCFAGSVGGRGGCRRGVAGARPSPVCFRRGGEHRADRGASRDWPGALPVACHGCGPRHPPAALGRIFDRPDRLDLYRQSLWLIRDYAFTGVGLGGQFALALSRYVLLIQVPYLTYLHNLYLEVWLQQGLIGAAAWVWLLTAFVLSAADMVPRGASRPGPRDRPRRTRHSPPRHCRRPPVRRRVVLVSLLRPAWPERRLHARSRFRSGLPPRPRGVGRCRRAVRRGSPADAEARRCVVPGQPRSRAADRRRILGPGHDSREAGDAGRVGRGGLPPRAHHRPDTCDRQSPAWADPA